MPLHPQDIGYNGIALHHSVFGKGVDCHHTEILYAIGKHQRTSGDAVSWRIGLMTVVKEDDVNIGWELVAREGRKWMKLH